MADCDDDTKIQITWPGFFKGDEQEGKCKDDEECGCGHLHRCGGAAGLRACCVSCWEALAECPRCTCFHVRHGCGKLGHTLGTCLGRCSRLCGGVFSVLVTLVGCLGMVLVVFFLSQALFKDDGSGDKKMT